MIRSDPAMPSTHINPWSKTNTPKTLQELRTSYPKYSDNELYVIWCKINGHIPLDKDEMIDQAQWQIHADEDGQFTPRGRFKVSRPLYGRALKAVPGRAKPKNAARGSKKRKEAPATRLDPFMSAHALAFAAQFDTASAILENLITTDVDIRVAVDQLRRFPRAILTLLAQDNAEAQAVLEGHHLV